MIKLKLFLVQASILFFALILIEGMLRIVNSDMTNYDIEMWRYAKELKQADSLFGHKHIKNKSSILQGVEIKLNSRGMRSDEFKNDEKKILAKKNLVSNEEIKKEMNALQNKFQEYKKNKKKEIENLKKKRNKNIINFINLINPIIEKYMADNSIYILMDKKNVFIANNNYDITKKLIELIDNQIKTVKIE